MTEITSITALVKFHKETVNLREFEDMNHVVFTKNRHQSHMTWAPRIKAADNLWRKHN